MSMLTNCLRTSHRYMLTRAEALAIMRKQIETIGDNWSAVSGQAVLSSKEQKKMMGSQFLNPFAFHFLDDEARFLAELAESVRNSV